MLKFLVESAWEKKLYRIEGEPIVIGRSRAADIPLLDEKVRKKHVEIRRKGGQLWFLDLSGGGTRHNGRTAAEGALHAGDRLEVGSTTVTLQAVLRTPAAGTAPVPHGKEEPVAAAAGTPSLSVRLDPAGDDRLLAAGLRAILEINKRLARERDEASLLRLVMDAAIDLTGAERGFILLRRGADLEVRLARGMDGEALAHPEGEVSLGIARRAVESGKTVLSADAGEDARWSGHESVAALRLRSVAGVPLVAGGEPIGALYLDNRVEKGVFTDRHTALLEAFGDQAALAIVSSRAAGELARRGEELAKKTQEVERLNSRLSAELSRTQEDLRRRQQELEFRYDYRQIIGRSAGIREVLTVLDKVTDLNVPVFIEGESGTGKELAARALHFNGPRRHGPFVSENCSAVPETLIEKVLFGHVRGAFTGAAEDAPGLFEQASGGTLFLDEIGDMSEDMQKKMLRVLQEGEVRRIGGRETKKVDVRIVCATNRDVDRLREEGRFREDLYFRLVVVRILMPPLRERREDIPLLVEHFLKVAAEEMGADVKPVESGALDRLCAYSWPGNVRELANEVRRALALAGGRITAETLSDRVRGGGGPPAVEVGPGRVLRDVVEDVEKTVIARELSRHGGNKTRAADSLGLSRLGLRNKMHRYGL